MNDKHSLSPRFKNYVWYDMVLDELYLYPYPKVSHANPHLIYIGEFE